MVRWVGLCSVVLVGCGLLATEDEPARPSTPGVPAATEVDGARRYVRASSLNLRVTPGGDRVGVLAINSPVTVVEADGDHVRVRAANGKEGWVPAAYLAADRLTMDEALAAVASASTTEERLAWAQRAAALDETDRAALSALEQAYRAAGQLGIADQLAERIGWPEAIRLAGAHWREGRDGPVPLEWATVSWGDDGIPETPGPLPADRVHALGLTVGQTITVLPVHGPAVRGPLVGAEVRLFNECGGTFGIVLLVDAPLPEGEAPIAYTLGQAPASWDRPAPTADVDTAIAVAKAHAAERGWTDPTIDAVLYGDGVFVRVGVDLATPPDDMQRWTLLDLQVGPDGAVAQRAELADQASYIGYERPLTGRDVDGDGRTDIVFHGLCALSVVDADGVAGPRTAGLCCGC